MTSLQKKASENAAGKGRLEVWSVKSEWAYVLGEFTGWHRRLSPHQTAMLLTGKSRFQSYSQGFSSCRFFTTICWASGLGSRFFGSIW